MAEDYFKLSLAEQAELLQSLATIIGRRANILEKDIWLGKLPLKSRIASRHYLPVIHNAA